MDEKLFQQRKLVGSNILTMIKEKGYTKTSFSKIIDISRPTLDKLIKGDIDNKTTFISHLEKIIIAKISSYDELLNYKNLTDKTNLMTLYSDNAPSDYERTDSNKEFFMILEDLINLTEVYK